MMSDYICVTFWTSQLIRLYWRESLIFLKKNSWKMTNKLVDVLSRTLASVNEDRVADGLRFFMVDIFWDELEKAGADEVRYGDCTCWWFTVYFSLMQLSPEQVAKFLKPYCTMICMTEK